MKVIKKINNNVAICRDNNNKELIAFGRGIGFPSMPYELKNVSGIDRTYYNVNPRYYGLLADIPEDIFQISAKIVDYANMKIDKELNPNIVFTLADHIHFAIQRYQKKMNVKMSIGYDIQCLYESEMLVGKKAVAYINKVKKIHLSMNEATGIAMHFINSEYAPQKEKDKMSDEIVIQEITKIIEDDFSLKIDKKGFSYSRFVSHMHYLLKRKNDNPIGTQNHALFEVIKEEFKETYNCVVHIKEYLISVFEWKLNEEELLYLMLHINRLCAREDCNQ